MNRAIAVAAVLTFSAISGWAQDPCTEDYLNETYTKWYEPYSHREDPKQKDAAYQIAKEYVNKCPNAFADNAYAKALKSYVQVYEKAQASGELAKNFETAVSSKNYADQIKFGKQLVAIPSNADNAVIYIIMAGAGLGDANQLAESAQAAKKAIELIEAGKPFTPAYQTKDQALSAMNYVIAKSMVKTTPTDAVPYFIKAAKADSKNPQFYAELAAAYGEQVDKLTKDYQVYVGKPETTESKLLLANLNQAIDAQIDAYARAAAVTTNPADKKNVMDALTELYKFRNKTATDADVNQLVASILSKPLPDAPKPITELPTTPTSPTPGATSGSGNGSNGSAPATGGSTSPKPAATGTTPGSPKPAATGTTTPAKPTATPRPRQRANHRG